MIRLNLQVGASVKLINRTFYSRIVSLFVSTAMEEKVR